MVMQQIEFLYDFGSPNAYLVHRVLPALAVRTDATIKYTPILLGGVFKATGNQSPMQAFAGLHSKLSYQRTEMNRFVRRHNIPFLFNPHFPVMTITVMRGAVFAQGEPWENRYIDTVFDAMWVQGKKMDDPLVIAQVLSDAQLPADQIIAATQTAEVKTGLIANTEAAVARGVFGAPTLFAGDEMFFGKDALSDLEWHLKGSPVS
jgi:2-hydroxychromene-2-carboxylate isomerase